MIAKLIVEGKEFPIEIQDPELQKMLVPPKKTGYERVDGEQTFYYQGVNGEFCWNYDHYNDYSNKIYDGANYYSDKTVAENNARADRLMRQLRRFAVEHRENELDWEDDRKFKFYIFYYYESSCLMVDSTRGYRHLGAPYFDSKETAQLAAKTFKDELIWYFTEYKDSL